MSNWLTINEFAELLKIGRSSVYKLIKKGMPSRNLDGIGLRILKDEAENWLLNNGPNIQNIKGKK